MMREGKSSKKGGGALSAGGGGKWSLLGIGSHIRRVGVGSLRFTNGQKESLNGDYGGTDADCVGHESE